jgi:hypothetical protein
VVVAVEQSLEMETEMESLGMTNLTIIREEKQGQEGDDSARGGTENMVVTIVMHRDNNHTCL